MARETVTVGERALIFETEAWAKQGNGVLLRCGEAVLLCTSCAASTASTADFFPLTVEYREKAAAFGRIPQGYGRRETRASDDETLSSRVIDRSLRPLFPKTFRVETQVMATVFSADPDLDLAALSVTGASLSLMLSEIPWQGPVAAVRVGREHGRFVAFPSAAARRGAELDFVVSCGPQGILMVEGAAQELPESELIDCLVFAQAQCAPLLAMQSAWAKRVNPRKRTLPPSPTVSDEVAELLRSFEARFGEALLLPGKVERRTRTAELSDEAMAALDGAGTLSTPAQRGLARQAIEAMLKRVAREHILASQRMDGRALDAVRSIRAQVALLPGAHGSALFERGETQALATATLGGPRDTLRNDSFGGGDEARFFLHYNFPPYSVGEVKASRGPGRREIGHGMLAQRALSRVIPSYDEFPYTVRITSDILGSNGSSSMATVCAGCLALMDAGVPIRAPVAGIAMGMVKDGERVAILTDILGDEDHLGDMDFKVCGTAGGVTALQMDLKIDGLSRTLLETALAQARAARLHVLERMRECLATPRASVGDNATKVARMKARRERIGDVIGPGGQTIRYLAESTGAAVDIDDQGWIRIAATDRQAVAAAQRKLGLMLREARVGEVLSATIIRNANSFLRLELFPGTEASMHISEAIDARSGRIEDDLEPGSVLLVRVLGVDDRGGIRVSRRAATN